MPQLAPIDKMGIVGNVDFVSLRTLIYRVLCKKSKRFLGMLKRHRFRLENLGYVVIK